MAAGLAPADRQVFARVLEDRGPLLAFVALIVLIACAGVLRWLFARSWRRFAGSPSRP